MEGMCKLRVRGTSAQNQLICVTPISIFPFSLLDPTRNTLDELNTLTMDALQTLLQSVRLQEEATTRVCQRLGCVNSGSDLKSCSRCGFASYCSKYCQSKHWKTHKALCSKLVPYKHFAKDLHPGSKPALCNITFDLPPICEEYKQKYKRASLFEIIFLRMGLECTRDMMETNIARLFKEDCNDEELLQRWQEVSANLYEFLRRARPGDIFRTKEYRPYKPIAPQQFRNTPLAERGVVRNGDRVVDIGFVDFGIIFDSMNQIEAGGEPVVVTGIEAEPFCVAKSTVMMQMIKNRQTSARSVVEVWMSSLWSKSTFNAFKDAAKSVLDTHSNEELDQSVRRIIIFWTKASKLTAAAAIAQQTEATTSSLDARFSMKCCSLSRQKDRVAYLQYFLTKALYEDDAIKKMVGSIVMCSTNPDIGITQSYADAMEAVPSRVFAHMDPDFQKGLGLLERARHYLEFNMERFMKLVRSGAVEFRPTLGIISADSTTLANKIRALNPHTVHWSNVIDYIKPREFHQIAKSISGKETAHFAHSCNWTALVYGTDVYDIIKDDKVRLHHFCNGLKVIEITNAFMDGFAKQGSHQHFRSVCEISLARMFVKAYFRYFFEGQNVTCGCVNGITPLKLLSPLARSASPAFFVFAYSDTGISFGANTYDFLSDD
jgi:hypothetical protein